MQDWGERAGGRLLELSDQECWELLGTREVGRIAWCEKSGPVVEPVNFVVHAGAVWIRTAPYSRLGRQAQGSQAAFEVDDVDDFTRSGWSVLARGTATLYHPDQLPADLPVLDTWPRGVRALYVALNVREVSGRRLLPS